MLVDRGSQSTHSIKFFLEKCALHLDPHCANENLYLSGPVSCLPQFIDVKNFKFLKLYSQYWNYPVSNFARQNSEHCSHGNKLVLFLDILTVDPIPKDIVKDFRVEVWLKLHFFNSNDSKLSVPELKRFLLNHQVQKPIVQAVNAFINFEIYRLKKHVGTIVNRDFELFTIKRDGLSPVATKELNLSIPQFIERRRTDLPDPNKLQILVHRFFIQIFE